MPFCWSTYLFSVRLWLHVAGVLHEGVQLLVFGVQVQQPLSRLRALLADPVQSAAIPLLRHTRAALPLLDLGRQQLVDTAGNQWHRHIQVHSSYDYLTNKIISYKFTSDLFSPCI